MGSGLYPQYVNSFAAPNWSGGINAGVNPAWRQEINSFGPNNNFTFSPQLTRDFNRYSQDNYTFNPRLTDNFNDFHNTSFEFAPEYTQNFNSFPSFSTGFHPSFQRNFNNFAPVYYGQSN